MQIDFSAAVERVNHHRIHYELCSVGIGGSVLSILTQYLSNRLQHIWWMVVGVKWLMLYQKYRTEVFFTNLRVLCFDIYTILTICTPYYQV